MAESHKANIVIVFRMPFKKTTEFISTSIEQSGIR